LPIDPAAILDPFSFAAGKVCGQENRVKVPAG